MAKWVSLFVKVGALIFVIGLPLQFAIYLQTLGGIWILQTTPALIGGLYSRWFHRSALLIGWLLGMVLGTWMAASLKFQSSTFPLHIGGTVLPGYAGIWALIVNLVIVVVLSLILNAMRVSNGRDETSPSDYVRAEAAVPAVD